MPRFLTPAKRNIYVRITAVAFLAVCAAFCAKHDRIESLISEELVDSHIRYLSSDELMGRGSFSENIRLAEDYIAGQFEQAGLQMFAEFPGYRHEFTHSSHPMHFSG